MAFTSLNFLIFAVIVICAYYATPIKGRWLVLLLASYAFYLLSSPKTFVFVLLTTVITFYGGKAISNQNAAHKAYMKEHKKDMTKDERKEAKAVSQNKKKKYVALVLIADFGILAVLKYFRYYLTALGIGFDLGGMLIPLGISFYTFQSAAYIIDLYRDKFEADTNIAKFGLFTAFFPQIIQGPISRHDQLAGQLYEGHKFSYTNLTHGAQLVMWGFFKKLVIADRVAVFVTEIFDNYTDYQGIIVFCAALGYSIQLYADFSGGIDIARGIAQMMGIEMTHNFNRPYFSDSISEFWRRWHMSLSFWCRDYIFYPVAMSKTFGKMGKDLRKTFGERIGKLFPVLVAQMATFLTIGIWHGAEFKYIAYGMYNGFIIILGLLLEPQLKAAVSKLHIKEDALWWRIFRILRTFTLLVIGRFLPKAASFTVAVSMFLSVFKPMKAPFAETVMNLGLTHTDYIIIAFGCIVWFIISFNQERGVKIRERIGEMNIVLRWAIYLGAIAAILALGIYGPGYDAAAFIYRGF